MYKYTILFSLLAIPLAIITIFLAGGGHGTYLPFLIFFPLGLLGTVLENEITTLFIVLGILQFPVYGFVMDKFGLKKAWPFLLGIHLILIAVIFILKNNNF
ncbi:hypothetical protein [Chryseobacterium daecheongense]|uniref:MFS transporter n=1 Tax=Chryseobacterium daecheongense TaxID=192389 RepID=A0A3N0VYX5_9FLAO|nr:hypothetical protein [Chryseobacterium daecheongense]ROH98011.1 hypothetical protein EGI05_11735 [Chryseobacterium daecheongense]TDX92800.1 hypothetical protein BCF50_1741 [Chryseobacterium daecheongense]